jgi:hypothetical protein
VTEPHSYKRDASTPDRPRLPDDDGQFPAALIVVMAALAVTVRAQPRATAPLP